jgi:O-antigen/teichoic acid export membrane protein
LLTVPSFFLHNFLGRVLTGELKIAQTNYANVLTGVSYTGLLVLFVILLDLGVLGSLFAFWLADIIACIYILFGCEKSAPRTLLESENKSVFNLTRDCWQYGRWNYLLMMSNFVFEELPLIILKKALLDNVLIGFFATARALARQSRLIAQPISQVLFPYTASSEKQHATDRTNALCRAYLPLMLIGVGLVTLWIKPVIKLLYGEAFLPAVPVFYAIAPGIIVWPVTQFLDIHIAASGRPKFAFLTSLVILPLVAGYCMFFIPRYGYVGAGIATSSIYMTNFIARLVVYRYVTGSPVKDVIILKVSDFKAYKKISGLLADRIRRGRKKR